MSKTWQISQSHLTSWSLQVPIVWTQVSATSHLLEQGLWTRGAKHYDIWGAALGCKCADCRNSRGEGTRPSLGWQRRSQTSLGWQRRSQTSNDSASNSVTMILMAVIMMVFAAIWGAAIREQAYTASAAFASRQYKQQHHMCISRIACAFPASHVCSKHLMHAPNITCMLPASHEVVAWAFKSYTGSAAQ